MTSSRTYLARAARLGLADIEVSRPGSPLCARDGRRTYAWQSLGGADAAAPAEDAVRVISTAAEPPAPRQGR